MSTDSPNQGETMIKCPSCEGAGSGMGIVCGRGVKNNVRRLECFTCHGKGEITEEHSSWIEMGRIMSIIRKNRDLSQVEMSKLIGVSAVTLSKMEHGSIEPNLKLYEIKL